MWARRLVTETTCFQEFDRQNAENAVSRELEFNCVVAFQAQAKPRLGYPRQPSIKPIPVFVPGGSGFGLSIALLT